jgi:pyrimidine operon attenuation protein/uracil phosphoribosyltransferase
MAKSALTRSRTVMDTAAIRRAIERIAHEIVERNGGITNVQVIGIRSRGAPIAERIADALKRIENRSVQVGYLDISFYRDDLQRATAQPMVQKTEILFDVSGKVVVLVDDVLFTGRTIRAAMDALMDLGRPKAIQLAVLIDRGHRELPIRADYVGKNLPTANGDQVIVNVRELDGGDGVTVGRLAQKKTTVDEATLDIGLE